MTAIYYINGRAVPVEELENIEIKNENVKRILSEKISKKKRKE